MVDACCKKNKDLMLMREGRMSWREAMELLGLFLDAKLSKSLLLSQQTPLCRGIQMSQLASVLVFFTAHLRYSWVSSTKVAYRLCRGCAHVVTWDKIWMSNLGQELTASGNRFWDSHSLVWGYYSYRCCKLGIRASRRVAKKAKSQM